MTSTALTAVSALSRPSLRTWKPGVSHGVQHSNTKYSCDCVVVMIKVGFLTFKGNVHAKALLKTPHFKPIIMRMIYYIT